MLFLEIDKQDLAGLRMLLSPKLAFTSHLPGRIPASAGGLCMTPGKLIHGLLAVRVAGSERPISVC